MKEDIHLVVFKDWNIQKLPDEPLVHILVRRDAYIANQLTLFTLLISWLIDFMQ